MLWCICGQRYSFLEIGIRTCPEFECNTSVFNKTFKINTFVPKKTEEKGYFRGVDMHNMKIVFLILLRGIAQVMLQNNALTGLLFLFGIFYNSWSLGIAAILGNLTSTLTACFFKYQKNDLENGIFGFNGTLVGIAVCFYFGFTGITILSLVVGAMFSSVLMNFLKKHIPAYTSPFILITWLFLLILPILHWASFVKYPVDSQNTVDFLSLSSMGIGQVMFQDNIVTGLLFLLGIAIHSRTAALYTLYGSLLGGLTAWLLLPTTTESLNLGLYGYNAVLCAIALGDKNKKAFLLATGAIVLSSVLNYSLDKVGMITLTAPFVLATWLFLWIKKSPKFNSGLCY